MVSSIIIYSLHTVTWFQVLLFIVCTQLNGLKFLYLLFAQLNGLKFWLLMFDHSYMVPIVVNILFLPSRLGLQNNPTAPLQKGKTPPMSVPNTTLNNLMVRFQ